VVWKGWDFFPHGTLINFMRWKGTCLAASLIGMAIGLVLFFVPGLNYGIDFKGGTLIEVGSKSGPADIAGIRQKLSSLGLGDVQIQEFGRPEDVMIRVEAQPGGEKAQLEVVNKIKAALGDGVDYRRTEVVGPTVSSELRTTGIIAVLVSILAICAYVWFRFEWQFAVGVVLALFHDVLLTIGVFAITQMEFDLSVVAALLTIVGYSVNDSVVVSDRVRENLRKYKKLPMTELLNKSINETLSRTILTGGATVFVLLCLLFLGGAVIRPFTFAILFGILIGTYSSIYVAAPVLDYLNVKRDWAGGGTKPKGEVKPAV
jgi:preprotein translocase SecF subunit